MAALKVTVDLDGVFFKNPVGRLHKNTYTVLKDEGQFGADQARRLLYAKQAQFGGGYPDVVMADEFRAVPMRMRRGVSQLAISANYGSHPLVRKYNRWIEDASTARPRGSFRGHRIYRETARAIQSHLDGRIGSITAKLTEGLT